MRKSPYYEELGSITFGTKLKLSPSKPFTVVLFFPDEIVHLRGRGVEIVVQGKDSAWKEIDLINTRGLVSDMIARAIASILQSSAYAAFVLNASDIEILEYNSADCKLYIGIKPSFRGFHILLRKVKLLVKKQKK